MSEDYDKYIAEDARLTILKELHMQTDGRLNDKILLKLLDSFAYKRSRNWLRTQLRAMNELGAIKVHEMGTTLIAEITQDGKDHVERRTIIEGIEVPSSGA